MQRRPNILARKQQKMLSMQEHHIDFLETQLDLVAKIGVELYAQHHIGEMGEEGED